MESVIAAPVRAQQYRAGVYTWSPGSWQRIKRDIVRIEVEQFGEDAFDAEYLEYEFSDPESTVVLMSDSETDAIVGFTYAVPVEYMDWPRRRGASDTAYICDTVLDARHQGMGLIADMMSVLEEALRDRGYRFVERDAAVANGYAAKIDRAYRGRIEARGEERDSQYGLQRFFRIRL